MEDPLIIILPWINTLFFLVYSWAGNKAAGIKMPQGIPPALPRIHVVDDPVPQ